MTTKPTLSTIAPQYLEEREWFRKKYEREIGKIYTRNEASIDEVEEYLKWHEKLRCSKEIYMYKEYVESPRSDNIPDVVWNGPLMKRCRCPMKECECQGKILLPPRRIPYETRYTWHPMYYLRALTCHKLWQPPEPQKTFAERLQEFVDAEIHTYKKLKEIGVLEKRGAEFCINRCFFYHLPEEKKDYEYFTLKQQILEAYKNRMPPVIEQLPEEAPVVEEEDPIIDGFYRSLSTQSNTGPNGEFIMGKTSHILFANMNASILHDVEGKKLNIASYKESEEIYKSQTITSKLDKLISLKRIKSEISKLTTNFLSSLIEIKDTGIPVISQTTQDPPLDHCYQSVKEIPLKGYTKENQHADTCPCCRFYKMTLLDVISNVIEQNSATDKVSNANPKLLVNPTIEQSFSDVKNEKIDGYITEESDKFSSSPLDVPQVRGSRGNSNLDKEEIPNESKKLIEENENMDKKLLSKSQDDNKIDIVEIIQPIDDSRLRDKNNITNIEQIVKETFDNVTKENNSDELFSSNEKNSDKILPTLTNIEKKVVETISVAEDNLPNQVNQIKIDVNEKSNDLRPTSKLSSKNEINNDIKDIFEKVDQSNKLTIENTVTVSHSNINFIEESQANINLKTVADRSATSITNVHTILNSNTVLKFNSTQKPSVKKFTSKNLKNFDKLKNRFKKAMSYENFKLHIKKSFQRTSSAFSVLFNCVDFKSRTNVRNSKESSHTNDISEEGKLNNNSQDSDSNKKDSKISEEEMFSLQYNSNLMTDAESSNVNRISPESREE